MKRFVTGLSVVAVAMAALYVPSGAQAVQLPPKTHCVTPTVKTVKKGNRQFRAEIWFTRRLHRAGCLDRRKPRAFKPFSQRCKKKTARADTYLATLQQGFIQRLDRMLLNNQARLLQLDRQELRLLNRRQTVNGRLRGAGAARRASLQRQLGRINRQLVTVRTKRARTNYRMNTRAITRRGAAGVWLTYFDGIAHGCLKAFRTSPYLTTMRNHFLVQFASAQLVSPPPTRAETAAWTGLISSRMLTLR